MSEDLIEEFEAVVLVGVFMKHHVSAEGIEEVLQMVKKGGYISFNFREDQDAEAGWSKKVEELLQ